MYKLQYYSNIENGSEVLVRPKRELNNTHLLERIAASQLHLPLLTTWGNIHWYNPRNNTYST